MRGTIIFSLQDKSLYGPWPLRHIFSLDYVFNFLLHILLFNNDLTFYCHTTFYLFFANMYYVSWQYSFKSSLHKLNNTSALTQHFDALDKKNNNQMQSSSAWSKCSFCYKIVIVVLRNPLVNYYQKNDKVAHRVEFLEEVIIVLIFVLPYEKFTISCEDCF